MGHQLQLTELDTLSTCYSDFK